MTIISNVMLMHPRLDPNNPNSHFDANKPRWEVQIRTTDAKQAEEWRSLNLNVKLATGKKGSPEEGLAVLTEDGKKQWFVNLTKRALKADNNKPISEWEKQKPVSVVDGNLNPVDPLTIGNGSIANVQVYQYDTVDKKTGKPAVGTSLMGVQLLKHIVYTPAPKEAFARTNTERITPATASATQEADEDLPDADPVF